MSEDDSFRDRAKDRAKRKVRNKTEKKLAKKGASKFTARAVGKAVGKLAAQAVPVVGDVGVWIFTENSVTFWGLVSAALPGVGLVVWGADIFGIDLPLLVDHDKPSPEDIDRLEGRGRGRGRSSRRRGRAATDGGQVVTGGDRNDDDDGSRIPSGIIRVFGVLLGLGALLVVGVVGVSGTAGDYGQVAAEEVQDETVGGIAPDISEDVTATYQRGAGALKCVNAGPGCIQEWRLENAETERPDSKDATKSFDLNVRNFQLGREGERFDISSESASEGIPIRMRAFNNRRGIDGIRARDVEFRIMMVNGEFDARTPLCDTGWIPIDKVPQLPGYDADEDGEADDLAPGTGVSGFLRLDEERIPSELELDGDYITPKSCHLLQPGVGESAEVRLGVRYEYFSTAGLIFQAMSEGYARNSEIDREPKPSLSPDTPVQASVSTIAPVTVNDRGKDQFSVTAELETDDDDVQFIANDMKIINSRKVCVRGPGIGNAECVEEPSEEAQDCSFVPSEDDPNTLIPKDDTLSEYRGKGPGGRTFFDDDQSPQTAGCQMKVRDPGSISRTGETLAIRMEANYTVIKTPDPPDFEAANLICTEKNCPHVFALSGDTLDVEHLSATQSLLLDQGSDSESSKTDSSSRVFWRHRRAECDGLTNDGPNEPGCTVVSGDIQEGFDQATDVQGGLRGPDGELQTIEEGEIAARIDDTSRDIFSACTRKGDVKNSGAMTGVHGIEMSGLNEITGEDAAPQLNWTGSEWELEDEESPCLGSEGSDTGSSSGGPGQTDESGSLEKEQKQANSESDSSGPGETDESGSLEKEQKQANSESDSSGPGETDETTGLERDRAY